MSELPYRLVDADNHYYEPRDCFTRYIEPAQRAAAIRLGEHAGRPQVWVGDKRFTFLAGEGFAGETTTKAGALREMLRAMKSGVTDEEALREPMQPAYVNRDARLALMDAQGIESAFLFPTLAVCVEHFMKDDVEQMYANLHAFNRWLLEDWGFDHQGRIYAPPLLSLLDLERALAELDWVLAEGARIVSLRPGPAYGRSPADPYFDPFWARLDEARVPVAFHIAESGYNELMSVHWGEEPNPSSHRQSAFQWSSFYGDRVIMDTVAALIFHNLFGRFPNLNIISVENGSLWVSYLMKVMDKMKGMGRSGPWPGGYVKGPPSEILKRHVFVSPYHEEDILELVKQIGASQVLFGSDFPHPEGLAEPREFAHPIESLPGPELRAIMRDNARRLVQPEAA
ncbi:MAG: amidohydrolase family protein [Deltaproteobacteria bacterium]|nr:amidohydrolase family protein [Deltaproteobacteria bacterium]